jgi:hypothetical protein
LLLAGNDVAHCTALRLDLVHASGLDFGGLLSRLLHFQKHSPPILEAEQVGHASQLVRPAVNLHDPPAALFSYPNYRSDD